MFGPSKVSCVSSTRKPHWQPPPCLFGLPRNSRTSSPPSRATWPVDRYSSSTCFERGSTARMSQSPSVMVAPFAAGRSWTIQPTLLANCRMFTSAIFAIFSDGAIRRSGAIPRIDEVLLVLRVPVPDVAVPFLEATIKLAAVADRVVGRFPRINYPEMRRWMFVGENLDL